MIVINNNALLKEYCEKYDIDSHFSDWEALTKKLVHYEKGEIKHFTETRLINFFPCKKNN
jgi:hypothetical protein